jgi:hypothetical protein
LRWYAALFTLLAVSRVLSAQASGPEPPQPKPLRFDITPLIGYRTGISSPIQPQVRGSNARVLFDANPSYGLAFGVRLDEVNVVEFRWARQDTSYHLEDAVITSTRQRAVLDQFHGDFTHEYIFDDWPRSRPFIMGSVGATHVSGASNSSFTRFSFGLGGGVKVFVNRHFGFRVQAEWLPLWVDPQVTLVCGGGCLVRLGGYVSSQGEVTIGPLLRF